MARLTLRISPDLELPALEAQTQTLVVYGGKGMGKTNFGAVVAEELDRCQLRFSWLDPLGVAWGLKHSGDGRSAGIEILILGGTHGDLPINPAAGAIVADLVVDEDVSVIIDISRHPDGRMWSRGEKIRFVRDYFVRLYMRQGEKRRPLMQIVDEAGRFVPQLMMKGDNDIAECVGAIETVVEEGRNVGLGVMLITQRSARMNKSVSELAEMMVAFRTVGPKSIDAIVDWFGEHIPKERQRELIEQLRKLPKGTALVVSPGWLEVEGAYAIRARETFDSSATPVAGKERRPRGRGAAVDVDKYSARMVETIEAAKASDPTELQKQIRKLERQLAQRPQEVGIIQQVEVEKIVEVEVPVFDFAKFLELQDEIKLDPLSTLVEQLQSVRDQLYNGLEDLRIKGTRVVEAAAAPRERADERREVSPAVSTVRAGRIEPAARPPAIPRRPARTAPQPDIDSNVTGPQQKLLDALAWWRTINVDAPTRGQLAFVAGYSHPQSRGFRDPLYALNAQGLVEYPEPKRVALTDAGAGLAVEPAHTPTEPDLQDMIYRLVGANRARMLQALVGRRGDPISREDLAAELGYSHAQSRGFRDPLYRLHSLELVTYPASGLVAASALCFLDERLAA